MSSAENEISSMDTSANLKRSRPSGDSPQNVNKKKPKKKGGCICPICLETIIESTKSKPGHDAIFCEGYCSSWLHRKCAGLPKPLFTTLVKSSDPYICPHCQLRIVTVEVSKLKEAIESLNKTITSLQSSDKPNEGHFTLKSISKDDQPSSTYYRYT